MTVTFTNTLFAVGQFWGVSLSDNVATTNRAGKADVWLNGTVTAAGDTFTLTNVNGTFGFTLLAYDSAGAFTAVASSGLVSIFSNTALTMGQVVTLTSDGFGDYQLPCFAAGTRILTRGGEVAVEALAVGDEVALAGGGFAPVAWLGQRVVDCTALRHPAEGWPLRVRAHAFGPGAPHRDLFLSPDHAVFAEGVLIPVRYLENGTTVRRVPRAAVTYFHVELPRHAVLLAEGLACESYLDTGNRGDFTPGGPRGAQAAALAVWAREACAPLALEGPAVARVRAGLAARAAALGHRPARGPGLALWEGGQAHAARREDGAWHVTLPAPSRAARLVSCGFVPAMLDPAQEDRRCLGVAVRRLVADGHEVPLDHPGLDGGWYAPEPGLRWTAGAAALPLVRHLSVELAPIGPWVDEA
jgi:hypothetical protein